MSDLSNPATAAHNALYDDLIVLAARYHADADIGGPFHEGDPAHVEEHNRVCRAMIVLRDAANDAGVDPPVEITLPPERFVGDSGHVSDHGYIADALEVLQAVVLPWEV